MCGIIGYIGSQRAYPIIINGLKRLEYRGYDSAGIALLEKGENFISKVKGGASLLELDSKNLSSSEATLGIGHTRWATHGEPNKENAHPHVSMYGDIILIHNGVIENYLTLKDLLKNEGYRMKTPTDTEVLANWIEFIWRKSENGHRIALSEAVQLALQNVVGAYAIAVISPHEEKIVASVLGSSLVLGIGDNEFFVASDATPFVDFTKRQIKLLDYQLAILSRGSHHVIDIRDRKKIKPVIENIELNLEEIEKGGHEHFMLKEIFEQPGKIKDSMRGRIRLKNHQVLLGGMQMHEERIRKARKIVLLACGTSWHSSLIGERFIERLARIDVHVEYASEFRYSNPILNSDDVVIGISQSGETKDTIEAMKLAKTTNALVLGICNVVGAAMTTHTEGGTYTHAGIEIGVASTKAFTAQLTVFALFALWIGKVRDTITDERYELLLRELAGIPLLVEKVLEVNEKVKQIARQYYECTNMLYLGRGVNFPVALEGALKTKEISYIHAEGYPAAEMKHGPIALIDEDMPVVFIANDGPLFDKVQINMEEVKARKGQIIAIITEGNTIIPEIADVTIEIPKVDELFSPFLTVIPLQLLAYHLAIFRGTDIDRPRNLAKSVTVE